MKKNICIIGLGFIGLPMLVNLASLNQKKSKSKKFKVLGLEKNNFHGLEKKNKILSGKFPIKSGDRLLYNKYKFLIKKNLIHISNNYEDIKKSDIVIISVGFDFSNKNSIKNLKDLFNSISKHIKKNSLIIIETTLPPGVSEKIIYPIIKKNIQKRNILIKNFFFGYSFERITPGANYLNSINNSHRAYAGINMESKKKIKSFLSSFINTKKYNLTEFKKIEECELCKIIENSYRSLNIAFIDEWLKFSMSRKLDLNKILDTIRLRETHKNIMRTGIGVGGYCLTKDGNFAKYSTKIFDKKDFNFPLTEMSIRINKEMVTNSLNFIKEKIHNLKKKKILIFGQSYKEDIGDFRNSPSKTLFHKLKKNVRKIEIIDPYFRDSIKLLKRKNYLNKFDIYIFCVKHIDFYKLLNFNKLFKLNKTIFDLNHVIPKSILNYRNSKKIYILGE
tara:strand:- start:1300 stop:2640 length:1341 start_codon:yes stop_codon:yes gene_type:complete